MQELLPLLHGAVVVGHHINFDAAMIDRALRRRFDVGLRNPLVDTANLAQVAIDAFAKTGYANQRPPTLDEVCSHLEIMTMERHTAAGDAFTTAELFLLLCARMRQQLKRPLLVDDLPFDWR
jgi:DNA polymerase-3 subunit epsilon